VLPGTTGEGRSARRLHDGSHPILESRFPGSGAIPLQIHTTEFTNPTGEALPADSTKRRRYCAGACRVTALRARRKAAA
jgi:hypothetical protein